MDELELEPAPIHCEQRRSMLKGEDIMTVLRELGYTCRKGDDFICVETEEGKISVIYDRLPIISVTKGYLFDETDDALKKPPTSGL